MRLLPDAMVHDLTPGKEKIDAFLDEWIVTDDVQGPRRFLGNHFEPLLRKSERKFYPGYAIETVSKLIAKVLQDDSEATKGEVRRQVAELTERFRPYPDFRG